MEFMFERHSIRLADYDYSQSGAYYVTLCAFEKKMLFGKIMNNEMFSNDLGQIIKEEWEKTAFIRSYVLMDEFVVMPNHLHGIIVLSKEVGATGMVAPTGMVARSCSKNVGATMPIAPTTHGPAKESIGAIIAQFKARATTRYNTLHNSGGYRIFQRNYYDHIIRDFEDLDRCREYIRQNPCNWIQDENYMKI
jgi:putative transposase